LPRGELTRRAEEIAARHFDIPASKRTSVSVDTLLDWALRYRNGGFEALAPPPDCCRFGGKMLISSNCHLRFPFLGSIPVGIGPMRRRGRESADSLGPGTRADDQSGVRA